MKIPQIMVLALYFIALLISANHHKQVYEVKENFWVSLGVIAAKILVLFVGGFFTR